jgi:aspartate aminotransferase
VTLKISCLARGVAHSGTLAADERMQALRASGRDIVSLGAGQLDFDTPAPIARAGMDAIASGRTRYTPVAGTAALRRAVRAKFEHENGLRYGDDEVIVGAGAKSVIYHALLALVDPGDRVIVPSPAWPSYAAMVALAGGEVLAAPLSPAEGWRLTPGTLRAAIERGEGRARGLIVNSPHNPTGAVLSGEALAAIGAVAREAGLWVISDEIYEHLVYDGAFAGVAAVDGLRARTLTVNGVSKGFAMTGWRIGYAGGPAELVRAMEALQSHTSGNPSSISQEAAEAALRLMRAADPVMVAERERVREALAARRDLTCARLEAIPGVRLVRPAGAFYVFADISSRFGSTLGGRTIRGSADLADHLLEEAGVAVVAGSAFGDDRCIRVSFAASTGELEAALARLARALG